MVPVGVVGDRDVDGRHNSHVGVDDRHFPTSSDLSSTPLAARGATIRSKTFIAVWTTLRSCVSSKNAVKSSKTLSIFFVLQTVQLQLAVWAESVRNQLCICLGFRWPSDADSVGKMFSFFYGLWKYWFRKDEYYGLILGLDNAGKTVSADLERQDSLLGIDGLLPTL